MLDVYIIEELKRRERERLREERRRPSVEIPVQRDDEPDEADRRSEPDERPATGGNVITFDL